VAAELGNTPAICRASYVHPEVLQRYLEARETIRVRSPRNGAVAASQSPEERALINFLDEHFPERRRKRRAA
jgi:DNA topoisomerase-1